MAKEVHQVSRLGAKATDPKESAKSTLLWRWWSTYTFFTSANATPSLPLADNPMPPPSPALASNPTLPPNPPLAKKQKQGVKEGSKVTSWIINPEPYVPKTTRVPTPSLKPLSPRPLEMSVEENKEVAAAEYEKWKAEALTKKEPEPKPVYTEKQKKWAYKFLTANPNSNRI
jgi:hypothetical protein